LAILGGIIRQKAIKILLTMQELRL